MNWLRTFILVFIAYALTCVLIRWVALGQTSSAERSVGTGPSLLTLDYGAFTLTKLTCNRDYMAPDIACKDWKGRAAVDFNLNVLREGFFRNHVHTEGTNSKVETVGWKWEMGVRLPWNIEVGLSHHSRHRMDEKTPYVGLTPESVLPAKFEVEDGYFVRFIFSEKK